MARPLLPEPAAAQPAAAESADVDVIIAVHDPARPIARSVASALAAGGPSGPRLQVSVVCHNLPAARIREALESAGALDPRVRLLELADQIPSPAGPFNRGIDSSRAEFVTTVGSDDILEPGALDAWYARALELRADAVLAPIRTDRGLVATPLARPHAPDLLDPVADGLAHRTAPLGLLRRETLERIGFRYTEGGLGNGEDIEPALRLWFAPGMRLAQCPGAPAYRVTDDMGASRQTALVGPLERELAFLRPLLAQPWIAVLGTAQREAILVKLLRAQVIPAIVRRTGAGIEEGHPDAYTVADARFLRTALADLRALHGRLPRGLALSEARVLRLAQSGDASALRTLVRRLWSGPRLSKVITLRPWESLTAQSPLRQHLAGRALTRARARAQA
ncbi:glycosyltransferase family 2 protein [Brachybacterium sp. JHP9]|uniref:Glycosyltransferase family 2 protein n=1 Tax=Brachybacterium equifaecis TaxID=2910770 RepID=A0ABT0R419_9MICO|nr:glycosyltransferase family A protein [Brachybacterium equifaecis]MCL6424233.1 glycosyltransferase family 2 protein [Brachybacterium equifaecis]